MTVAIEDEGGLTLGYGVIANVSESGACVWTDGVLSAGARLLLRVSFAQLCEVHEIGGLVVWESAEISTRGSGMRRFGVEWRDASAACVARLRQLALRATEGPRTPTGSMKPVHRPVVET